VATVNDAASGQASAQDTAYRCRCGGFLLRSRDRRGVIRDVLCSTCKRRTTVFLGGRRPLDDDWPG